MMTILKISLQIKSYHASTYVSIRIQQYFRHYDIKHVFGISHNPTGQTTIGRANRTLKEMLIKQKGNMGSPKESLNNTLWTLPFLKCQ